jgi:EVE domain
MTLTYWLDLYTYETWTEFLKAGASIAGFREARWKTVQRMKPGDILLCYLTGVGRWIGLLEVTGPAFKDKTKIWSRGDFPSRIHVKLLAKLEPLTAVPVVDMKQKLSVFQNLKSPHAWTGHFRGSPAKWKPEDGKAVVDAVNAAVSSPVEHAFDAAKLAKIPPVLKTSSGKSVVIPGYDEVTLPQEGAPSAPAPSTAEMPTEVNAHLEIQWLLLKLGSDVGLDVWVAKNDRNRNFQR